MFYNYFYMNYLKGVGLLVGITSIAFGFRFNKIDHCRKQYQNLVNKNMLQQYLHNLHNKLAYHIDKILDAYQSPQIGKYRQILISYAVGNVLQVCAGSLRNNSFYKYNQKVLYTDWSPEMVTYGISSKLLEFGKEYIADDIQNSKLIDNQFDTVVDTFGLQYVYRPQKALKQMIRVCKKDGYILLIEQGQRHNIILNQWERLKQYQNVINGGFFKTRNWQAEIADLPLQIQHYERKMDGKIYFYILKNKKES